MKISKILDELENITVHVAPRVDKDIQKGVVGDLLSFIMGSAPDRALWITIHTHVNVAAVALLKEIPLVILASGRVPSPELAEQCVKEDIALATADMDSFGLCGRIYQMGIGTDSRT